MQFKSFHTTARKLLHGILFLCLWSVSWAPAQAIGEQEGEACQPGSGWTWTRGPSQPALANEAELALHEQGIAAEVSAFAYGEQDSCGNFEAFSTDYSIDLTPATYRSGGEELASEIGSMLSQVESLSVGNVQIRFPDGQTRFYSEASKLPSPSANARTNIVQAEGTIMNKRVYLLVYNPILSNGQDFNTFMGWPAYADLVDGIINSFEESSHGQLRYAVTDSFIVDDEWPVKIDGFRYTEAQYLAAYAAGVPREPNDVDYDAIVGDPRFDICGKFNRGEFDELWIYGGPYDGFYESRLVGPGAYWFNSPPMEQTHGCNRLLSIMGLNFERGLAEAMHSFGHRAESTMVQVYGSWEQNRTSHNWERFTLVKALSPSYTYSGCGNIHYPPNGVHDYDYDNPGAVNTNCDDFVNYPALGTPPVLQSVTCSLWGCDHLESMLYWFRHLPSNAGCGPDTFENNWWLYFADPQYALNAHCGTRPSHYDFDGDRDTDIAIFRRSQGFWYIKDQFFTKYGIAGDIPVAADYDGDGDTDIAIYRPSQGFWYIKDQFFTKYGIAGDVPMPGDYDGDGDADLAIFRRSQGFWYIKDQFFTKYGIAGDIPVPGDYDGDGDTDIAIFRPSQGFWYIKDQFFTKYGIAGDIPVPGDYDGDGDTDLAIYRPSQGMWYIKDQYFTNYGIPGDIPVPADYDGDGDVDLAVYRPSQGMWYVRDQFSTRYGIAGDIPIPVRDTNGDGDPYQ